jgi:tetratricopeptide (TPR) repeat protein
MESTSGISETYESSETSSTSSTSSTFDMNSVDSSVESVDNLAKSIYCIKLGDLNYDECLKFAEYYKEQGNKFFFQNNFHEAIDSFTSALNLSIETPKNAIFYSNRANCHNKLENYGLAIQDANKAIEIDKEYYKSYYRRASANLFLSNFDDAIKDLEILYSKFPNDEGCLDKLKKAKAEKKKIFFVQSIVTERTAEEYLILL